MVRVVPIHFGVVLGCKECKSQECETGFLHDP
jgi:hypothetical protein